MERISWEQYFMAQSHLLAQRSTCPRLMVGATIVRDNRIIAGGYNGSVSRSEHCIDEGCYVVDNHCVRTVHAEANALLQCAKFGVATDKASIYVTHFPCLQCSKQIIQSGIRAVYYANDYRNHEYASQLFKESGIQVKQVELNDLYIETNHAEKTTYIAQLLDKLDQSTVDKEEIKQMRNKANELFQFKK